MKQYPYMHLLIQDQPSHLLDKNFSFVLDLLKLYDSEASTVSNFTINFAGLLTFAFSIRQSDFWIYLKYMDKRQYTVLLSAGFYEANIY